MKTKCSIIALLALVIPIGFLTAGPIDPKTVPADADWYMHVNLDELSNGKIGDWMMEFSMMMLFETGEESPIKFFTDDGEEISGGITLYGSGRDPEDSVIRASGLRDHLDLLAEIEKAKGYRKSQYGGVTVHSWTEGRGPGIHSAFLDDETMIASQSAETLEEAIDFHRDGKAGIRAPRNAGVAILGRANLEDIAGEAESQVLRSAKSMESTMDVAGDGSISGTLRLETSDAESAEGLFMMIDGMIAFGAAYVEEGGFNPGDHLKAKQDGATVEIEMALPIAEMEKLKAGMLRKGVDA